MTLLFKTINVLFLFSDYYFAIFQRNILWVNLQCLCSINFIPITACLYCFYFSSFSSTSVFLLHDMKTRHFEGHLIFHLKSNSGTQRTFEAPVSDKTFLMKHIVSMPSTQLHSLFSMVLLGLLHYEYVYLPVTFGTFYFTCFSVIVFGKYSIYHALEFSI